MPESFGTMRIAGQWAAEAEALLNPGWAGAFSSLGAVATHYGNSEPQ